MKIAIGTDHAGYEYKEAIKQMLIADRHEVVDCGCFSTESCDYPQFIRPAAQAVARGECDRGIVLGGSGNGEAIVANRERGVRCVLCWNVDTARLCREHNDANVLSIGARQVSLELALEIVKIFLTTPFEGGRHSRRIAQIDS